MDFISAVFTGLGMLLCAFIWFLPILLIGTSDRTQGKEKFAWILAVIFITWFAWVFYLLLAPIHQPSRYRYR